MKRQRIVCYFDPAERKALQKLSEKRGSPVAELVRRAVREWLKKQK